MKMDNGGPGPSPRLDCSAVVPAGSLDWG